MNYKNANIYTRRFCFEKGAFSVENGRFVNVLGAEAEDAIDLQGAYVIPGLIDVHTHGNSGADFSDGEREGVEKMAKYFAANGITSFAPASMTLPVPSWTAAPRMPLLSVASRWKAPSSTRRKRALRTAHTFRTPTLRHSGSCSRIAAIW